MVSNMKIAQEILVVHPENLMDLIPLEVSDKHHGLEVVDDSCEHEEAAIEVCDQDDYSDESQQEPLEIEIFLSDLPGAPEGTRDPEPLIEVSESDEKDEEDKKDENDAKVKKTDKWDWTSKGLEDFVLWVKSRIDDVPKHSGQDSAGLQRAIAYLEKLDDEVSKAMRLDLDGELDANQIEKVRAVIDNGVERLNDRLDKIKNSKKKTKKKAYTYPEGFQKEAQKIAGIQGIIVTVPLLISRIARVCINGSVSAGHDIEDLFQKQVKQYDLDDREQAEVVQLLEDMGYTIRQDRGYLVSDEVDLTSSDNLDLGANYGS